MSSSNNKSSKSGLNSIPNSTVTNTYGGMSNFMNSYGLKTYNTDEYAEAKQIINAFKQADYQSQQPNPSSGSKQSSKKH